LIRRFIQRLAEAWRGGEKNQEENERKHYSILKRMIEDCQQKNAWPPPGFSLPGRGKSLPRLHKAQTHILPRFLIPTTVPHNIQSWPHSKGSEARPSGSITFPESSRSLEKKLRWARK
jgi:hypothetical protein